MRTPLHAGGYWCEGHWAGICPPDALMRPVRAAAQNLDLAFPFMGINAR